MPKMVKRPDQTGPLNTTCEAHQTPGLTSVPSAEDLSELHRQFFEARESMSCGLKQ